MSDKDNSSKEKEPPVTSENKEIPTKSPIRCHRLTGQLQKPKEESEENQ